MSIKIHSTATIPAALRAYAQWVCWRYEDRNGKRTKAPINAKSNGKLSYARTDDPTTWASVDQALAACGHHPELAGIGFCFAADDGLTGIDLDHVIDAKTGELTPDAMEVLGRFKGTYCEVSPSGTGLRLFCYGKPRRSGKNIGKVKWLEVYSHPSSRYLTVTGLHWHGTNPDITNQQDALNWLHQRFMAMESTGGEARPAKPSPAGALNLDDEALIEKASTAKNGPEFARLWSGDPSAHGGDDSAADLALCNLLAFWTDHDAERMDRLFRQSGLMRPKWDSARGESTYGKTTIARAIAGTGQGYSGRKPPPAKPASKKPVIHFDPPPGSDPEALNAQLAQAEQTDTGNSDRIVARHGHNLRYCQDFGKWLVWDGVRWAMDRHSAVIRAAKDTARKILLEAAVLSDREDARKLAAWSFRSQARDRLGAMLYLAQPDVSVLPEQLDTHPWLLNVANGTIDLRTGQLTKPNRADLLTKTSPVLYDPGATCPQWLAFITRIFDGKADVIRYVQKAAGYSLTGLDTEECFFVLHGVGANGKSTFVETLSALLGTDYAQQATPDLLMQKKQERHATELAVLRGARMVASVETGQGKRLNEVLIKAMTGGDRIRANFMHQDTFEFRPEFKVWLSTNHKPVITGTDLGIWRRIRLIPFTVQIPDDERDGAFKTRLREPDALSGILNWVLEGVLLWRKEGLKPPAAVVEATQAYRDEMDVLAAWISECCIVKKLAEARASELYKSYSEWCEAQGERPESQRSFGLRLVERGFDRNRATGGAIRWLGIGLLSEGSEGSEGTFDIKDTNSGDIYRNVENRFTSFTSFTPSSDSSPLPPVESLPPLTANERKAVAILRDLHRKHAENLKSGGLPPSGAKVTTRDFIEGLRAQRIPSEAAAGLKSRGLAVEENGFWRLTEHGLAVIS